MQKGENRKTRSDKKTTIAPYMSSSDYELICLLGYICGFPLKKVGELVGKEAIRSTELIANISVYFRRDFKMSESHFFLGRIENKPFCMKDLGNDKKRLYMRFHHSDHSVFAALAYALDCSVSAAAGLIIHLALYKKKIAYSVLGRSIFHSLDLKRAQKLKVLCRELDEKSSDNYITMNLLMSHVLDECVQRKKTVDEFINEILK